MRQSASAKGLTVRVITGTYNAIIAMNLSDRARRGCLGFSIRRTDLDSGEARWLPNMLRFPSDEDHQRITTARAPLQTFRWGDYTLKPGKKYRYDVIPRYGKAADIIAEGRAAEGDPKKMKLDGGVSIEIAAEDCDSEEAAVFFNRGAAASQAYINRFGDTDPDENPEALKWLSRGLEEALIAFMEKAEDDRFALHACMYEFQKPELLAALKAAADRGAEVEIVYHARERTTSSDPTGEKDHTVDRNDAAAKKAKLTKYSVRRDEDPEAAIMHNKFIVLLKKDRSGDYAPLAVAGGSTNWTAGGIYGQLNVAHMIYEEGLAKVYEDYFQLLKTDPDAKSLKRELARLSPVPATRADLPKGVTPIFSPQSNDTMLDLYGEICKSARLLMVSAPFQIHAKIQDTFEANVDNGLNYVLMDTKKAMGAEVELIDRVHGNRLAAATLLKTRLHDFQGRLLSDRESYHHAGIHVHSKIILADPFSDDPIVITGSANFSANSTRKNDENTILLRGNTTIADIYATEFMRMFTHYEIRARRQQTEQEGEAKGLTKEQTRLSLREDETWSDRWYEEKERILERPAFAGG